MSTQKLKVGDKVNLPLNEVGNISKILSDLPWGFKYRVKLRKANKAFGRKPNQIHEYKEEQLELIPICEDSKHKFKTVGRLSFNGNSIKCEICDHVEYPF